MNLSPFWLFLIAGVALVAIELIVFQFSTFWLLFIGLGALVAAAYAWILGDVSYTSAVAVFLISSVAITALLYAPIRRWQTKPSSMAGNDAVGQSVEVVEVIERGKGGSVVWSGSDWQAELAEGESGPLLVGETATVAAVKGIRLIVKPISS